MNLTLDDNANDINYKEILDHLECPIYVTDANGVTRYVNLAYLAENPIVDRDKLIGRSVGDIIQEGKYFNQAITMRVLHEQREAIEVLSHHLLPDKSAFVSGRPIYDAKRGVKNVVSIMYVDSFFQRLNRHFDYPLRPLSSFVRPPVIGSAPLAASMPPVPLIGASEAMTTLKRLIMKVAPIDASVLITGESGTGKDVVATLLQQLSPRRDKPFVKINCAAIPANLLESELFGYEKGAFTGALARGKPGVFEQANGGTLFLDEIGDMPWEAQSKLLRVLQDKVVQRVGGMGTLQLDVRIIAATNADLQAQIRKGTFRKDLYYRLNLIPMQTPPLRQRRDDIPLLLDFYSRQFDKHYRRIIRFDDAGVARLAAYDWPGNVRELRNFLEYMYVCQDDNYVDMATINSWLRQNDVEPVPEAQPPVSMPAEDALLGWCRAQLRAGATLKTMLAQVESDVLRLAQAQHKTTYAIADRLGVAQPTVVRKLQAHGIGANRGVVGAVE